MSKKEKNKAEDAVTANTEPTPTEKPKKTPAQIRQEIIARWVMFVRGVFHALFTFSVYFAWAEVISHLLPPHLPLEFLALLGVTFVTFAGWVSGIDIITGLLEPWNVVRHPKLQSWIAGKSDKREQKTA